MGFVSRFDATPDLTAGGDGLRGLGAASGSAEGVARLVHDLVDLAAVEPGDIIVARTTMPTFNASLAIAGGVVTEIVGLICHASVIAREFRIPAAVGVAGAMQIPDGAKVRVDGDNGTVTVLS